MPRHFSSAFFKIVLACSAAASLAQAEPVFHNPIVKQRADPQVYLHTDGYYYFTATVPEYDRIEVRRARSIDELGRAEPHVIWRKHEHGPMGAHIWAPEIHFIDGKWFVYFTSAPAEHIWDIRMWVLENDSADPFAGQWIERGQIQTKWESFTLDATTFEHRGTNYLVWAQHDPALKNNTSIFIAKMKSPTEIDGGQVELSRPELAWETKGYAVNEGPAVLKKNGRIFITYSASATDANYCMGLLTAKDDADLLDAKSWSKSPQPVFATSEKNHVYGPGHNSFTTTPDGAFDILIYHARSYRDIKGDPLHDPNRDTRAQVIHWRADGTPDFGEPK